MHVLRLAMRGRVEAGWRCSNDMSNDAVVQTPPMLLHVHIEFLERLDRLPFDSQVSLSRRQLDSRCRSGWASGRHCIRVRLNPPLQNADSGLQGADTGLDGDEEVVECFCAHDDNFFLRASYSGVVQIALIFSKETKVPI